MTTGKLSSGGINQQTTSSSSRAKYIQTPAHFYNLPPLCACRAAVFSSVPWPYPPYTPWVLNNEMCRVNNVWFVQSKHIPFTKCESQPHMWGQCYAENQWFSIRNVDNPPTKQPPIAHPAWGPLSSWEATSNPGPPANPFDDISNRTDPKLQLEQDAKGPLMVCLIGLVKT